MIDVIIPAYNAHDTILSTLLSIYYQDIHEKVNVYICNDCSDKDYRDEVAFFDGLMNVKEITLTVNSGPGIARQAGLDNSNGEFVMFMDSDDTLASPFAISNMVNKMINNNLDIAIGNFMEEQVSSYRMRFRDTIWLHGKMYRRAYLVKHDIRFNETRANEDNGFNQSIILRNPHKDYVDETIYQWRYNPASITRRNNSEYKFSGLVGYVYNITWALDSAIRDEEDYYDSIADLAMACLYAMWYYYLEFHAKENAMDLVNNSTRLLQIYKEYPVRDPRRKEAIAKSQHDFFRNDLSSETLDNPYMTIDDFIKLIEEVEV